MGLDLVEMIIAVEERFGIEISDAATGELRTVGDLHALVLSQLRGTNPDRACINLYSYRSIRGVLRGFGPYSGQTMLSEMLQPAARVGLFAQLESMGLRVPQLLPEPGHRGLWLKRVATVVCASLVAIGTFFVVGHPPAGVVGGISAGLMAWVVLDVVTWRRPRSASMRFPDNLTTVRDLVRAVAVLNIDRFQQEGARVREGDVWDAVVDIVATQTGRSPAEISPGMWFIDDLQMS